ncbi:MAG: SMP-30/gluconolactonase/LRE family protein [Pyrinomonadaceae bacterium]
MEQSVKLSGVEPTYAIPGGEIALACEGFRHSRNSSDGCYIAGIQCRTVAASTSRILAIVPDGADEGKTLAHLESNGQISNNCEMTVGRELMDDMHIVANPAVDPSDDAVILTRSGARGQHLPATLYRLEPDGYLDELPEPILNPTGIAFDKDGQMFVTNRAQGEVYAVGRDGTATVHAAGLGIATGIAFDSKGVMYVGDRTGTIYRVSEYSAAEAFAKAEQSVAAYHMAFGPDGRLYLSAPGLASHDAIYAIDTNGDVTKFFRGLGRPQGLAFDKAGNLYAAACYRGRHGIVRIDPDGSSATHFLAGNNIVGLCFTKKGDMIVATGDRVFTVACGIEGTLLP